MQTFTETERARLRTAFDALVTDIVAPELDDITVPKQRAQPDMPRPRSTLLTAAALVGLLMVMGWATLLVSTSSEPFATAPDRGDADVIVFFPEQTAFDALIAAANEALTWEGVMIASPWSSEQALEEFRQAFADEPDLIAAIEQDPSVLPSSVRLWVEPGADISAISERARSEFPDALQVTMLGEPRATDEVPSSTLLPLHVLVDQVEPIEGYGDYSGRSYTAIPWAEVTSAQIECMVDQGWPVVPEGSTGISWTAIAIGDNQAAQIDFARCVAGLNLPQYRGPAN